MSTPSVLIFGATGRIGNFIIEAGAEHPVQPELHAFVRNPDKLTPEAKKKCKSVIKGDATNPTDIQRALEESEANYVIIGMGTPHLQVQDIRERNALAVAQALGKGTKFEHVKIIVISAIGAGDSKALVGYGIGTLIEFILRNPLADHDKQEAILMGLNTEDNKRVLVVRPTGLTEGKATGKVQLFGARDACPSIMTDREDLGKWIVQQICEDSPLFGTATSIANDNLPVGSFFYAFRTLF